MGMSNPVGAGVCDGPRVDWCIGAMCTKIFKEDTT